MQTGVGLLILDVMPIYMIIALDIVIIICSSINCPTVICLPTVCYFSQEKPLVKSTAPGSNFPSYTFRSILLFAFLFICIFYFQIYISKNPKIPCCTLFYSCFIEIFLSNLLHLVSRPRDNFWHRYPKGIDNPFNTSGCKYLFFVSGTVYIVLLGSPTSLITLVSSLRDIPVVAVLHHPYLFGEIPT